ncbi:basic amino acid/polyamine antiporter [Saccharothrix texasensis]|uniref:Arginine:ornithine antiporter (APA family) n=1 Tax=Saccharothrix texasensis TaxID=103734 RepID=A0A3N1GZI4_9PSEU|nr:basic amino acid/polyamine antiporter [Saccharothrix texasensis]ROP35723.1 arginine:ornithine antiporter (APA family) [Saccharothrix texasensis]
MTVTETEKSQQMPLLTLTAMVVGSMVGAGVFSLPRNFAQATGVLGAIVAWVIAGVGMLMLAFVFQTLAVRKPELDAGVYAYAKAGFGEFPGFFSAFGYWASACVGNVSYWVLIKSTLGTAIPGLGEGNTVLAVAISALGVWAFHYVITRGVKEAAAINRIVTIAKLVPILVFVVILAVTLKADVFSANFWGGTEPSAGALFEQVRSTMLVTVFVFLGVEGASVYSRYARKRTDVGRATVLGFLSVLALFASVTLLSYGALGKDDLGELRQPSMMGVLESVVGTWGSVFIGLGLIISVLGAYLAWTLMAAEVLFVAAKDDDMPRFLKRENRQGVPIAALVMTSVLITAVLAVTVFSDDAFTFTLKLCSSLSLIPYLLAAGYALRIGTGGEDRERAGRRKEIAVAALAVVYTLFLIFAAGIEFLLLSFVIYAPGTVLFVMARREQGRRVFSGPELVLFIVAVVLAVSGVIGLATGLIVI